MTSPRPDPLALLDEARAGDGPSLGRLLDLYRAYLRVLARVQLGPRLRSKIDESDVVQETFLKATREFASFRGATEKELMGWLRRILGSHLLDLRRRFEGAERRDVARERQLAEDLDHSSQALGRALPGREPTPSQSALRRERAVLLADALERLPGPAREVIVLHNLEGLTFPDVAARMGRSPDAVKQLWMRALARLRRELGDVP